MNPTHNHVAKDYLYLPFLSGKGLGFDISIYSPESSVELMPFESESLLSSSELCQVDNLLFSTMQNTENHSAYPEGQGGCERSRSPTFTFDVSLEQIHSVLSVE